MDTNEDGGSFICPECGSTKAAFAANVSRIYDPDDPWSAILQTLTCARCGFEIPAHLGERWSGISIEEAQQEWREIYRADARREKRKRA